MVHGYKVGDMVWGKVKSYPWWPGMICNEAFAADPVYKAKKEGCVLVVFYGDNTFAWLDRTKILPFEAHYINKCKQTNGKLFVKAVGDALEEISRRAALGLTCNCRNPSRFRPTKCQGFLEVDVSGYEVGALYSTEQIENAKGGFLPCKTISSIRLLAVKQETDEKKKINMTKHIAEVLAYRKAKYEDTDHPYYEACGLRVAGGMGVVETRKSVNSRVPGKQEPVAAMGTLRTYQRRTTGHLKRCTMEFPGQDNGTS